MATKEIPVWEKAALTIEETASYMGVHENLVRALANASKNDLNDFPAFWVGRVIKVARKPLLKWLADVATSHRDLKRAAAMVENATKVEMRRGRPRKRIISGGV
jgi:hypothetical protein